MSPINLLSSLILILFLTTTCLCFNIPTTTTIATATATAIAIVTAPKPLPNTSVKTTAESPTQTITFTETILGYTNSKFFCCVSYTYTEILSLPMAPNDPNPTDITLDTTTMHDRRGQTQSTFETSTKSAAVGAAEGEGVGPQSRFGEADVELELELKRLAELEESELRIRGGDGLPMDSKGKGLDCGNKKNDTVIRNCSRYQHLENSDADSLNEHVTDTNIKSRLGERQSHQLTADVCQQICWCDAQGALTCLTSFGICSEVELVSSCSAAGGCGCNS